MSALQRASARTGTAALAAAAALVLVTGTSLAAPRDGATPKGARDSAAKGDAAAAQGDWRSRIVDRIERQTAFPARGYCREGVVRVTFMIDRAGKLVSSQITESSNVPAFDVEALAIIKRAQPFPPPPAGVAGPHVALVIPIRFNSIAEAGPTDKRSYLHVRADRSLTLDGAPVQKESLEKAIDAAAGKDKSTYIGVCGDADIADDELNRLAERLQSAGFRSVVLPRPASN
jgi:TonB family protein